MDPKLANLLQLQYCQKHVFVKSKNREKYKLSEIHNKYQPFGNGQLGLNCPQDAAALPKNVWTLVEMTTHSISPCLQVEPE